MLYKKTLRFEKFAVKILSEFLNKNKSEFVHKTLAEPTCVIDLECDGITYDVKYSNIGRVSKTRKSKTWAFDIRGKKEYCDYFVLVGVRADTPISVYLVPSIEEVKRSIRIPLSGNSKYSRYKIWDLV